MRVDLEGAKDGIMYPVGVDIMTTSVTGGIAIYLKKRWWLRLYHMVTFQDMSPILLMPSGAPVEYNRGFHFASMTREGAKDWQASFDGKVGCESSEKMSLFLLCMCPWIYRNKKMYYVGARLRGGYIPHTEPQVTVKEALKVIRDYEETFDE